jgi:hypothetical protein
MNRSNAITADAYFLRVVLGMLRAVGIALAPVRINAQHDVAGMVKRGFHDRVAKEDVGIRADEPVSHVLFGVK